MAKLQITNLFPVEPCLEGAFKVVWSLNQYSKIPQHQESPADMFHTRGNVEMWKYQFVQMRPTIHWNWKGAENTQYVNLKFLRRVDKVQVVGNYPERCFLCQVCSGDSLHGASYCHNKLLHQVTALFVTIEIFSFLRVPVVCAVTREKQIRSI